MREYKLFEGDTAQVSTYEFHEHRERAAHLEQPLHRPRLEWAAGLLSVAANLGARSVSDLGCGDGGLLSILPPGMVGRGYDFAPANVVGWVERGVQAERLDVFGADRDKVILGDVTVVTEVLEHLTDPHAAVRWIGEHSRFIVASSPWDEGPWGADPCHAWAWDQGGYWALIAGGGYRILRHDQEGRFQLILGVRM